MKKKEIIGYTLVLLTFVGLACLFPVLWGVIGIISFGYWIYVIYKWAFKETLKVLEFMLRDIMQNKL